jgi:hypothetical protein
MDKINSLTSYEETCKNLKAFSHDFCQRLGFNTFWVSQYHIDGSVSCLGTDLAWNQIALEENHYKDFASIISGSVNQLCRNGVSEVIWSSETSDSTKSLDGIRQHNNSLSGFNLFMKSPDGITSFGFSSTLGANTVQSIKTNNSSLISQFLLDTQEFVSQLPAYKIMNMLPEDWFPNDTPNTAFPPKIPVTLFEKTVIISGRQLQILKYTAIGYSYKETAYILGLSHKTIEFHIGVIRELFNKLPMSMIISESHKTGLFHLLNQVV